MQSTPIDQIVVAGFKSIKDAQTLRIRPLTLIGGANSTGKSSMLQPLLLLKQSIESASDPGPLKLLGANVKYSSGDQILTRDVGGPISDSFSIGIDAGNESATAFYRWESKKGFELTKMICPKLDPTEFTAQTSENDLKKPIAAAYKILGISEGESPFNDLNFVLNRDRIFYKISGHFRVDKTRTASLIDHGLANEVVRAIENVIHLPGLRGNPERTYPVSAVGSTFPGLFQDYTASLIVSWQNSKSHQMIGLRDDMKRLGLSWKVRATRKDDTQVEIEVGRLPISSQGGAMDLVNIADVGLGVSQTLPLLVALHAASKKNLVFIEQPEIHLHPRAQGILADIMVNATKRGVTIVLETHSSTIIRRIQTLIASQQIEYSDVSLNWFSRDKEGYTVVANAIPDEAGSYGDWPEDFDEVSLKLESEYLTAVEKRRARTRKAIATRR